MDVKSLDYCLTKEEQAQFEREGFFIIPDVLDPEKVKRLNEAAKRLFETDCPPKGENINGSHYDEENDRDFLLKFEAGKYSSKNCIGRDDEFFELLDWPSTFPKVWGILGWNIQLYHTHLNLGFVEPKEETFEKNGLKLSWHQDTGQLNQDLETNPRPRISVKVGYLLTDESQPHSGQTYVIPGSHLQNEFPGESRNEWTEGAIPLQAKAGSAIIFDRRLWHSASANYSNKTRVALFYGYSYRWLRPRDNMTAEKYLAQCDLIQKQLLGFSYTGGFGYTSPSEQDVPLKTWLEEHIA